MEFGFIGMQSHDLHDGVVYDSCLIVILSMRVCLNTNANARTLPAIFWKLLQHFVTNIWRSQKCLLTDDPVCYNMLWLPPPIRLIVDLVCLLGYICLMNWVKAVCSQQNIFTERTTKSCVGNQENMKLTINTEKPLHGDAGLVLQYCHWST